MYLYMYENGALFSRNGKGLTKDEMFKVLNSPENEYLVKTGGIRVFTFEPVEIKKGYTI